MGFTRTIWAASAVLALSATHAEAKSLKQELAICSRIQSPTDRLACFDRLAKTPTSDADAPQAQAGDGTASRAPKTATEQRAAKREARVAPPPPTAAAAPSTQVAARPPTASEQRSERRRRAEQAKPEAYDAVVLHAWENAAGDYFIALTNGEVWKSGAHDRGRPVKDREAVALDPGAVGSWFMQFKTTKRPAIRVTLVE